MILTTDERIALLTAERDALKSVVEGRKPLTRGQFDALPPADRMAHMRAGGTVTDSK